VILVVNGDEQRFDGAALTVADLVDLLGCGRRGVAIALNDSLVPRSTWEDHGVHDHDRVEILRAVQGG
jgi:sulfur carrier protein